MAASATEHKLPDVTANNKNGNVRPSYRDLGSNENKTNSRINNKFLQTVENKLSIRRSTAVGRSSHDDFSALHQILLDKNMCDEFRQHLVKTFSSENLDFWYVICWVERCLVFDFFFLLCEKCIPQISKVSYLFGKKNNFILSSLIRIRNLCQFFFF